ncbi:hypothetical protein [Cohnella kolymensis]|uniref:hypothetical protein n=1 Tax=Cohnella kolymensis TaxID=1590652 RepID=UPI000A9098C6|nr:hypothetical protein [Cohnella kolymensis]
MGKSRLKGTRPLLRKSSGTLKARLSARQSQVKAASGKDKKQPDHRRIVRIHHNKG